MKYLGHTRVLLLLSLAAVSLAVEDGSSDTLESKSRHFTARMFTEVVKSKPHENVVVSPVSVLTPLSQLSFAAVGESKDELLLVIGTADDNDTVAVYSQTEDSLQSLQGVELISASKVYVSKDREVNETFTEITRSVFNSEIENINFGNTQDAAVEINAWVENKTNHRIKDLVDAKTLAPNTLALLVNAIYFKGSWKLPFNAKQTRHDDFHVTKKETIKIPMMYQTAIHNYTEDRKLKSKIVELMYDGDQASMIIVVPNKLNGLSTIEKKLKDPEALNRALKNKVPKAVDVALPKFSIETTTDLKEILQNLDVSKIFTPGSAQLDNLLIEKGTDLSIGRATQKAFIEVNEEGSEAGASNVFYGIGVGPHDVTVHADRPFYFEIRAKGLTLFSGVKVN